MLQFKTLTNVRPTKELGCQVIAAPTEGQIKVTPDAADVLEVGVGNYLQVVKAGDVVYVVKGEKGIGSKLASANKAGGGVLTFSSAMSWQELNGDENNNTHYDLDAEGAVEQEGRTYYPLAFVEKVEKQKRKSKSTEEASGEAIKATPAETSSPAPADVDASADDMEFGDM